MNPFNSSIILLGISRVGLGLVTLISDNIQRDNRLTVQTDRVSCIFMDIPMDEERGEKIFGRLSSASARDLMGIEGKTIHGFPKPHGDDEPYRCFETHKDVKVSSQFVINYTFIIHNIRRTMPDNSEDVMDLI